MIPGLIYISSFLSEEEESSLLELIYSKEWRDKSSGGLSRRTQHYGYEYSYNSSAINKTLEIPEEFNFLIDRVSNAMAENIERMNQLIINEYIPGQGISDHIDKLSFGSVVVSISLASDIVMEFSKGNERENVLLERRSAIFLTGEARYQWKHGIRGRKSDVYNGVKTKRGTRVSITLRRYN